jgi:hypothetical protein
VRTASPARRAAGLLAVTTIGLSTAVLSVTGVASAAVPTGYTFSTNAADDADVTVGAGKNLEIPEGYCSVNWSLVGGQGGTSGDAEGDRGGSLYERTAIEAPQTYKLSPGANGGDAAPETAEAAGDGTPGEGGKNAVGDDGTAGAGFGSGMGNLYSAGGGAGSRVEVVVDGAAHDFLFAYGGDGAYADSDGEPAAGLGAGDLTNVYSDGRTDDMNGGPGPGSISGEVIPCEVPIPDPEPVVDEQDEWATGAPNVQWVQGVERGLDFQLTISSVNSPVTGVEYSLDGGTWAAVDSTNQGDYQYEGTISGLETGREYSVRFRFTTEGGPTEASAALTGTPVLGAPTDLRAAVGTSSILISWAPPAGADADDVDGYEAWAIPTGAQSSADLVLCPEQDAAARSCLLGVPAGTVYSVGVAATNGVAAFLDTGVEVPAAVAPATLPTGSGSVLPAGASTTLTAGEPVTMTGDGYLPGSTIELLVYSTPVSLGSVVAADGSFSATVDLPTDLPNGTHHLVSAGVDGNGDPRYLVTEITVVGGVVVSSSGLAYTGFSAAPFLGVGALALVAGGGLLVASRRRQA